MLLLLPNFRRDTDFSLKTTVKNQWYKRERSNRENLPLSLQYSQIGSRKNIHFLKRCSVHHSRALYQYVKQRYPDVNEEREIKNILTNMVLVTIKLEYIWTSWLRIIQAIINSVEMYLNHESSGRKFSLEIVHLFMPESSSLHNTGNIKSVETRVHCAVEIMLQTLPRHLLFLPGQ